MQCWTSESSETDIEGSEHETTRLQGRGFEVHSPDLLGNKKGHGILPIFRLPPSDVLPSSMQLLSVNHLKRRPLQRLLTGRMALSEDVLSKFCGHCSGLPAEHANGLFNRMAMVFAPALQSNLQFRQEVL